MKVNKNRIEDNEDWYEMDNNTREYLPAERQNMILNLLTQQDVATVPELAKLLKTTEITVRRDLSILAEAGLLKRIRGGAMSVGIVSEHIDSTATATTQAKGGKSSGQKASRQKAIGIMLPEPSFFWPGVTAHMQQIAAELGMTLITRNCAYDEDIHEELILQELVDNPNVCGIITAPNSHQNIGQRTWKWIEQTSVPTVVVERDQPLLASRYVDSVCTNHHCGVRKAAAHFLERGHIRIGAAFSKTPTSDIIQEGWQAVVERTKSIDCPFTLTGMMPYDTEGVGEIVNTIIRSRVTAVLVHSDYLAIAIARALENRGKRVPEDVSLISIDGFATPSSRPLTVLRSPERDLAECAVRTLVDRLHSPDQAIRQIYLDPALIDRGSVIKR